MTWLGVRLFVYLRSATSFSLTVGQEGAEQRKLHAVMEGQQVGFSQLETGWKLSPQLPHTVQEEQEDRRLNTPSKSHITLLTIIDSDHSLFS